MPGFSSITAFCIWACGTSASISNDCPDLSAATFSRSASVRCPSTKHSDVNHILGVSQLTRPAQNGVSDGSGGAPAPACTAALTGVAESGGGVADNGRGSPKSEEDMPSSPGN